MCVCVGGGYLVAVLQQESSGGQLVNSIEVKSTGRGVVWGLWDFLEKPNKTKVQTDFIWSHLLF